MILSLGLGISWFYPKAVVISQEQMIHKATFVEWILKITIKMVESAIFHLEEAKRVSDASKYFSCFAESHISNTLPFVFAVVESILLLDNSQCAAPSSVLEFSQHLSQLDVLVKDIEQAGT